MKTKQINLSRINMILLFMALLAAVANKANAQCLPGCASISLNYSTGIDNNGNKTGVGSFENHWTLNSWPSNADSALGTAPPLVPLLISQYAYNGRAWGDHGYYGGTWTNPNTIYNSSNWISPFPQAGYTKDNPAPNPPFIFERKFCVCEPGNFTFSGCLNADDVGEFWIDNTQVVSSTGWNYIYPYNVILNLSAGTHTMYLKLRNTGGEVMGINLYGIATHILTGGSSFMAESCCVGSNVGRINGRKFQDINENGIIDAGDNVKPNWDFTLTGTNGTYTSTTNGFGYFNFVNIPPGIYTLSETVKPGWAAVIPLCGSTIVTITAGTNQSFDFLNANVGGGGTGSITGRKYADVNKNGMIDASDSVLTGWDFFLDYTIGNIQGSYMSTTDNLGYFHFNNIPPGVYTLHETLQPGWTAEFPSYGSTIVILPQGTTKTIDFLNKYTPPCTLDTILPVAKLQVGTCDTCPNELLTIMGGISIDHNSQNNGADQHSLRFGPCNSGEAIGCKRTPSGNQYGLDFYTGHYNRMSITHDGAVGISTIPTNGTRLQIKYNGQSGVLSQVGNPMGSGGVFAVKGEITATSFDKGSTAGYFSVPSPTTPSGNRNWAGYFQGNVNILGEGWITKVWNVSDSVLKKNINSISNALSNINQLHPKSYDFKVYDFPYLNLPSQNQIGFLAQDVQAIFPHLVDSAKYSEVVDTNGNLVYPAVSYLSLDYNGLIPIAIAGIQELDTKVNNVSNASIKSSCTLITNSLLKTTTGDSVCNSQIYDNGTGVGIGTDTIPLGYKMVVEGKLGARDLIVACPPSWPDYVFGDTHILHPLDDVENYINTNKHLPGIPSSTEIEKAGINVGTMHTLQMEKIEELYLYVIEMNKNMQKLATENKELKVEINNLINK
jgi:hypothetical protein